MKLILVESQKLHQKNFWSFSNKVVRFRKITILQPSFSNIFFYPISKDHLCIVTFGLMYGLYSRATSNQERPMMARV